MLALGYDAKGLIVQNSWGVEWGFNGYGRLGWNVVAADVNEAYTIDGFANSARADLVAVNSSGTYGMVSTGSSFTAPAQPVWVRSNTMPCGSLYLAS